MGRTTRVRGYSKYSPTTEVQTTLRQIIEVLEDYRNYWPLTIRQVFYRLVGVYSYAKTERAYQNLIEYINRCRREYRDECWWSIPWEAIRDDGVNSSEYFGYRDAGHFLETVTALADRFSLDLMHRQAVHLEVMCEAGGMVPQIATVAHQYGVSVSSSGGFDSTTRKHELARRLSRIGKPVHLLHVGDYDPSGVHMFSSLDEDVIEFIKAYGGDVEMHRLAITPEQIEDYELPTAPVKATDNRKFDDDFTVQAEALSPPELAGIIDSGIRSFLDMDIHAKALRAEKQVRGKLIKRLAKV